MDIPDSTFYNGQYTRDLRRKRKRWKDGAIEVLPASTSSARCKITVRDVDHHVIVSGYLPSRFRGNNFKTSILDEEFQIEHYIVRLDEIDTKRSNQLESSNEPESSSSMSSKSIDLPNSCSVKLAPSSNPMNAVRKPSYTSWSTGLMRNKLGQSALQTMSQSKFRKTKKEQNVGTIQELPVRNCVGDPNYMSLHAKIDPGSSKNQFRSSDRFYESHLENFTSSASIVLDSSTTNHSHVNTFRSNVGKRRPRTSQSMQYSVGIHDSSNTEFISPLGATNEPPVSETFHTNKEATNHLHLADLGWQTKKTDRGGIPSTDEVLKSLRLKFNNHHGRSNLDLPSEQNSSQNLSLRQSSAKSLCSPNVPSTLPGSISNVSRQRSSSVKAQTKRSHHVDAFDDLLASSDDDEANVNNSQDYVKVSSSESVFDSGASFNWNSEPVIHVSSKSAINTSAHLSFSSAKHSKDVTVGIFEESICQDLVDSSDQSPARNIGEQIPDLESDVHFCAREDRVNLHHDAQLRPQTENLYAENKAPCIIQSSRSQSWHIQLHFRSAAESNCFMGKSQLPLCQTSLIPNSFGDADEYCRCMVQALVGQIQLSIDDFAVKFWEAVVQVGLQSKSELDSLSSVPQCECKKVCKIAVSRSERNPNRPYFACPEKVKGKYSSKKRNKNARNRKQGCNFFQWADQGSKQGSAMLRRKNSQLLKSKSPEIVQNLVIDTAEFALRNSTSFVTMMRTHMISIYTGCTLKVHGPKKDTGDNDSTMEEKCAKQRRFFLHLPHDQMEGSNAYSLGQVWMISTQNPVSMLAQESLTTTAMSSYWFMRSTFHGHANNMIGMQQLPCGWSNQMSGSAREPATKSSDSKGRTSMGRPGPPKSYIGAKNIELFAIRLPESFTLEFDSIDVMSKFLASARPDSFRIAQSHIDHAVPYEHKLLPALLDPSGLRLNHLDSSHSVHGMEPSRVATMGVPLRLHLGKDEVEGLANDCIARFNLNQDQISVLKSVASWFLDESLDHNLDRVANETNSWNHECTDFENPYSIDEIDKIMMSDDNKGSEIRQTINKTTNIASSRISLSGRSSAPIVLVHGVFGAGKSFLVVVLIIFVREYIVPRFKEKILGRRASSSSGMTSNCLSSIPDIRIMIAAATNVAVDGLLQGLLKRGFTDFSRVGRRDRIAPEIRKYEHKGTGSINKAVVGVTCASVYNKASILSTVNDIGSFDILFLDECSQMIEPQSLLPIYASQCSRMILVGDPMQLPPVIKHSNTSRKTFEPCQEVSGSQRDNLKAKSKHGIERSVFVRLSESLRPIILRTQYRCHPAIGCLSSSLFYNGRIRSGVSAADRAPIVQLAPIIAYDTRIGNDQRKSINGQWSYENDSEADVVCKLVEKALCDGISPCDIGVIAMFRAQAALIEQKIACLDVGKIVENYQQQQESDQMGEQEANKGCSEEDVSQQSGDDDVGTGDSRDDQVESLDLEEVSSVDVKLSKRKREGESSRMLKKHNKTKRRKQTNTRKKRKLSKKELAARNHVKVSTVDAFQGAEREIIILSTTRTSLSAEKSSSSELDAGHLESPHRLNVALTRARRHLLIVGHLHALYTHGGSTWKHIITELDGKKCIFNAKTLLANRKHSQKGAETSAPEKNQETEDT